MPNIGEWFGLYSSLRDNVGATAAATQAVRAQLETFRAQFADDAGPYMLRIVTAINNLAAADGGGNDAIMLDIAAKLLQINDVGLASITKQIADQGKPLSDSLAAIQQTLKLFLFDIDMIVGSMSIGIRESAEAQKKIAERITKLIDELFAEHSPALVPMLVQLVGTIGPIFLKFLPALPILFAAMERLLPEKWAEKLNETIGPVTDVARQAGLGMLGAVEAPLKLLVETSLDKLESTLTAYAPADIGNPKGAARDAIILGHEFGITAHGLATAVELFAPLKTLGLSQMAAYLVDLAGFKPISQAIGGAMIEGAITQPMRWWGNAVFQPQIPPMRDLVTLVQKRVIDEQTYSGFMAYHGYPRDIADYYTQMVWRDFSIRDIALAMEDTTIDQSWLEPRIMRLGFDDNDAQQITKSLVQRGAKTARFRVMSSAYAAVSSGSISIEDYRTILQGLDLRQTTIDYEVQAATIASHNDYVKDSIAVYRKQYVNGVIDEGSFRVALSALGLPSERIELVAADAWAQIAPRIAREERAQIEDVMREVQRYLVPAYRELMELGLISDEQYVQALIAAGVSPEVAQQSAILARMRINAVATRTQNKAAERELAQLYSEREELYVEMYRREQITEGGLASSLAALGINPQRVAAIVDTERTRKIPPISRPPKPPADAKERYIRDLAIQAAVAAFRTGKITEGALKQALITNQMSAEEADALVQLEVARKR